ncbi:hypothetical protein LTS18_011596, partial [Coniosporium uncinatum]
SRGRLFVVVSAPGLHPLAHPNLTHAHPTNVPTRSLGKAVNGEKFGERKFVPTAFGFISASESVEDLPYIDESRVQTCIPFPDHRLVRIERPLIRAQIRMVPVSPPGSSFVQAIEKGLVSQPQLDEAFSTVTTKICPADALCGVVLHWEQHRVISVMEARRAQGFPDSEVIVGNPYVQWHIIGNSVARGMALGLGMSLREAWLTNGRAKLASTINASPRTPQSLSTGTSSPTTSYPTALSTTPYVFERTKSIKQSPMVVIEIRSHRHRVSAQFTPSSELDIRHQIDNGSTKFTDETSVRLSAIVAVEQPVLHRSTTEARSALHTPPSSSEESSSARSELAIRTTLNNGAIAGLQQQDDGLKSKGVVLKVRRQDPPKHVKSSSKVPVMPSFAGNTRSAWNKVTEPADWSAIPERPRKRKTGLLPVDMVIDGDG